MSKVNTYGLVMRGLRKAAGATKSLRGPGYPHYVQISYDMATGDVLIDHHYTFHFHDEITVYKSPSIINVGAVVCPLTMQHIANSVANAVTAHKDHDAEMSAAWEAINASL
jgi:hypothetical protein